MTQTLVFDNTALSHFARANQLGTLGTLCEGFRCVTVQQVITEIFDGIAQHAALGTIPILPWLEIRELVEIDDLVAFARYKGELGGGPTKNNGEAGVLAWASRHGGTALIDEAAATRIGLRDGIDVRGTLWLVTNAYKQKLLTRPEAENIVDQLAATTMRLPTDGAQLFAWAYAEGLLP